MENFNRLIEIAALTMCGVSLFLMAKEDLKDAEVAESLCYLGWIITLIAACLVYSPWWAIAIVVALFIVFLCNFEASLFGDADYVPIAMFVGFYGRLWGTPQLWMLPFVCVLLLIVPYGKWWGKHSGQGWHLGCRKMVPALPLYFCTWCLSGVCYMIYAYAVDAGWVEFLINFFYTRM